MNPQVKEFFHEPTSTFSYVVYDEHSRTAAVIDSVLDYDHKAGSTSTISADEIVRFVESNGLSVEWILETPCRPPERRISSAVSAAGSRSARASGACRPHSRRCSTSRT